MVRLNRSCGDIQGLFWISGYGESPDRLACERKILPTVRSPSLFDVQQHPVLNSNRGFYQVLDNIPHAPRRRQSREFPLPTLTCFNHQVHHFYANSLPYGILEPPLTSVARYPTILGITWNKLRQNSAVVVHLDRFHIQAISNPCPVHFKHRDGMEVCSRRTQQGSASDAKSVGGKRLPWYFWLYSCFKYSAGSTKSAVVVAI